MESLHFLISRSASLPVRRRRRRTGAPIAGYARRPDTSSNTLRWAGERHMGLAHLMRAIALRAVAGRVLGKGGGEGQAV